jgi:hypothetical protein
VLRLASLLWRLRRITAIETDRFQIQAETLRDQRDELPPLCTMNFKIKFPDFQIKRQIM